MVLSTIIKMTERVGSYDFSGGMTACTAPFWANTGEQKIMASSPLIGKAMLTPAFGSWIMDHGHGRCPGPAHLLDDI
jgi:hypothetical protein